MSKLIKLYTLESVDHFFKFATATLEMVAIDPPLSGLDFVSLMWTTPQYEPEKYVIEYSCKLQTDGTEYVKKQRITTTSDSSFASVPNLLPNSLCELALFAVYNPATIDSGSKVFVSTLKDDGCKKFVVMLCSYVQVFLCKNFYLWKAHAANELRTNYRKRNTDRMELNRVITCFTGELNTAKG